jgi:Icc-related predicted phosphoesterase
MKSVVWTTDIHLNFIDRQKIERFCNSICAVRPDALLIGGDIGEALDVTHYLQLLSELIPFPIYFVLGNHDFYRGSIAAVRNRAIELSESSSSLHWMPQAGIVRMTDETCLVGHDGWADARIGDYEGSNVMLNDYKLIAELSGISKENRKKKLHALGDDAADHFRRVIPAALSRFKHVLVLTHVPPFRETCWHEGQISSDDYLPHFSCKAVGDVLFEQMQAHPENQMTVLCGHTHSSGVVDILPNLLVKTGAAVYGNPEMQEILKVP